MPRRCYAHAHGAQFVEINGIGAVDMGAGALGVDFETVEQLPEPDNVFVRSHVQTRWRLWRVHRAWGSPNAEGARRTTWRRA